MLSGSILVIIVIGWGRGEGGALSEKPYPLYQNNRSTPWEHPREIHLASTYLLKIRWIDLFHPRSTSNLRGFFIDVLFDAKSTWKTR